jgi:transposase
MFQCQDKSVLNPNIMSSVCKYHNLRRCAIVIVPTTTHRTMPATMTPRTARRELTQAERAEIIGAHRSGAKAAEIAARFGHKKHTVYYTIRMDAQCETHKSKPRSGRPRKTDEEKDEQLAEAAMAAPAQPLRELTKNVAPELALRTVRRRLKKKSIQKFRARRKPKLTERHRSLRLTWALEHVGWEEEQWKKVVWSDECSIELGSRQATPYVFRLYSSEYGDTDLY